MLRERQLSSRYTIQYQRRGPPFDPGAGKNSAKKKESGLSIEKASPTEIWSDEAILIINVGFDRFFPGVEAISVDKKFSGILGKRENALGVKNGTRRVAG